MWEKTYETAHNHRPSSILHKRGLEQPRYGQYANETAK